MLVWEGLRFFKVLNSHGLVYEALREKKYRLFFKNKTQEPLGFRLCEALKDLGPTFVKLGQMLATRPDVVSKDVAQALTALQDRMPPFSGDVAVAIVEKELGDSLEILFAEFDRVPVASASIAQVHKARLMSGEIVAVKVLRPNIEADFARDVALFFKMARFVEKAVPRLHRFKPREVVTFLQDCLAMETDLRLEGSAASKFRKNFDGNLDLLVPKVHWSHTARRVLTLSWIDGVRIDNKRALLEKGLNPEVLLEKASIVFFTQVFEHGYFHGDLHPGNVFVTDAGQIAVMDFGIMGSLSVERRKYLADLFHAFIVGDYDKVADLHFDTGIVDTTKSRALFAAMARSVGEPMLERPMREVSLARLLGQVFELTEHFQLQNQVDLLLVHKNMMLSEGIGNVLNPDVNMWQLARPHIVAWMKRKNSPRQKIKDLIGTLETTLHQVQSSIRARDEILEARLRARKSGPRS
jgi:ubiquinone biosynthesis protein